MSASFNTVGWRAMSFSERLVAARKQRGLSQRALADAVGVHLTQIQRYEAGTGQPTLDVVRRLAIALSVSADMLVFDPQERGPQDDDLKLIFEAVEQFTPDEKATAKTVLQGLVLQHHSRKWAKAP
jgi:transcriptional regulator with XRE-family HTH domain